MPDKSTQSGDELEHFALLLRNLRVKRGLSQSELAAALENTSSYVSRLEAGQRRPSLKVLKALAAVLEHPYDDLARSCGLFRQEAAKARSASMQTTQALREMIAAVQSRTSFSRLPQRQSIPVYDRVPAGLFKDAQVVDVDDEVLQIVLSEEEVGYDPRAFGLIVSGDSMLEAGILDGDLLVVSPAARVQSGDIAVVQLDGSETTVKKVFFEDQGLLLQPCNSRFKPMLLDERRVQILGRVILVRRKI